MSLCCSIPDECLVKSSGNDRNLHVTGENFPLLNILFENSKSDSDGRNVAIESGDHHQIIGCKFCNGQAYSGGNLDVKNGVEKVTLIESIFSKRCSVMPLKCLCCVKTGAKSVVGAAAIEATSLTIDKCRLEENTARIRGGFYWGFTEEVKLKNSKFLSNVVTKYASGFFASCMENIRSLEILNCSFEDNQESAEQAVIDDANRLEFVNIFGNLASGNDANGSRVLNSCGDLVDYGDGIFFIFGGTSAQNVCV
jgi:hypothetical protein